MRKVSTVLAAGVSLIALVPAYAQEPQPTPVAGNEQIEEENADNTIIVQARRRDEDIQDVPAVINAVTSESIEKLNLRTFNDVATLVPGLELSTSADGIAGGARLRGVNFDTRASGNNATVEFYFNDAPISAGIILQQMYDIGQIEVQRGPQGTLRGRASPSGAITITSRKADLYEFGGFADVTGNDIGTINLKGGFNVPIIEGIAAIRVAGVFDESEGDRVRPVNRAVGATDPFSQTKSGRISALVTPTDWLRLEGTYQRLEREARTYDQAISFSEANPGAPASPLLLRAKDRRSIQEEARDLRQTYDIYNWRAELSGFGQRLIYQGQRTEQKFVSEENTDSGNLFPNRDVNQLTLSDAVGTSHEIRVQNEERVFGIFDYVVGFFDSKLNSPTTVARPTIVRLPIVFGGGIAQIVNTAVGRSNRTHEQSYFGHLTAHIGEATEVSGGLRQIEYDQTSGLVVNGATLATNVQDVGKLIYTASIKREFSDDFLVYASTGSSFRPGINVVGNFNIAPSARELSFVNLPPETSKSYEVGFKSSLFDKRLRFNVTAYHQKFKNFPYRVPDAGVFYVNTVALPNPPGGTAQQVAAFNFVGAVPVEVNGVEGEASFDMTDRWNVGVIASYSLGKIKGGSIPCNDLNGDGVPDVVTAAPTLAQLQAAVGANNVGACQVTQRSAFLPPFTATLTSEYGFPVSPRVDAYLRGLFSYNGKSQGDPANAFDDAKAYGLLNLYTGVRDPKGMWEVAVFAKNIFDTTRVLTRGSPLFTSYQQLPGAIINGVPTITGRPSAATFNSTYTGATVTPPREIGVNVRFAFGSR